jgi:ATP-binding cassette subfamily C protein
MQKLNQQKFFGDYLIPTLKLLSKKDRFKIKLTFLAYVLLSLLDMIGIATVGVLTAITVQGVTYTEQSQSISTLISLFKLDSQTFQMQVALLGTSVAVIFTIKTFVTMYLSKKIFYLMSYKCAKISNDLAAIILKQDILTIQKKSSQESLYSVTSGVNSLFIGILAASINILSDLLILIIIFIGLLLIDPFTAIIIMLSFSLIAWILYKILGVRARKLGEELTSLNIASNEKFLEALGTYRELVVHNRQEFYLYKFQNIRKLLAGVTAETAYQSQIGKYVIETSTVLLAIIFAGYQYSFNSVIHATTTLGIFIAAVFRTAPALLRLQQGVLGIKNNMGHSKSTVDLISRMNRSTQMKNTNKESIKNSESLFFSPSIVVNKVKFKYDLESNFELGEISHSFIPKGITAIVGPSGSGKSTFVDLILGIYEPTEGVIEISGVSPRISFKNWPGAISYVPQESLIVEGTFRDNVLLGYDHFEFNDQDVWDVLELAGLKLFVSDLPNSLDSKISEKGSNLSGGQRQRLGIARALISKPKILILDEATSSLDSISESEVTSNLKKLSEEISIILIAHRPSTINIADEIIILDSGRISANGSIHFIRSKGIDFGKFFTDTAQS